ncbi:MAG: NAD(P)-dependent glycerol-3-phosphate dehydrogenase [Desulfovibrio sp.]|jgi:glycerol-3-phosphate dehydrogenase (NAD(P)+)|nr:NAD(P)-dependent glycerol-3-phosphate dehydrogenase [Desulfovibrio sp.]
MEKIAVIGGGAWGTALADMLAGNGKEVALLVRSQEQADDIALRHVNSRYLPGLGLCEKLRATLDPKQALTGAGIVLLAVPCQHMAEILRRHAPCFEKNAVPVCVSKGIEISTRRRMQQVVEAELPEQAGRYAALSGPSFAREVIEKKPTTVVLACASPDLGDHLLSVFASTAFRVYSSRDVVGVETGGAVKNVIAIAAGVADGLGLGHNARAGLITRGLAEMRRLGVALGAEPSTFMGLSGLGDLVLTCTGDLSRNRQAGLLLGQGVPLDEIRARSHSLAEGLSTTPAVCGLAERLGIEQPIAEALLRVMRGISPPREALRELMSRSLKEEY